jgi:hypothetical protein
MMLRVMCEAGEPVPTKQRNSSNVRQYIPPDSMMMSSRRRYCAVPCITGASGRPPRRSTLFTVKSSMLTIAPQRWVVLGKRIVGHVLDTPQHEGGSCDVCCKRERGYGNHEVHERRHPARVVGPLSLGEDHTEVRNC